MELFVLIIAITATTGAAWAALDLIEVARARQGRQRPGVSRRPRPRVPAGTHARGEVHS